MSKPQDRVPSHEPIAVVGMACRFPGGGGGPHKYWGLLCEGSDAIGEPSPLRRETLGAGPLTRAGYLDSISGFNPSFFGISPGEARNLDPQQRLLLELSWELFEHAGRVPAALSGTRVGVFVGAMWSEYAELARALDPRPHTGIGVDPSMLAARVAHAWDLCGPSLTVQTASSSSLMAVHLACQSLWRNEADAALTGGVNLIVSPRSSDIMAAAGTQSRSGRCRPFDANADGYTRGEGAGLVMLVRLRDALANGDRIICVIRATAANGDGRTESLTRPSLRAQEAVLRSAWVGAGLAPSDASYIEAHGTGTPLGDATELAALASVFAERRDPEVPLRLGSVKSNVGHLEAAAGIAGLIKTALAISQGQLPATIHCDRPNPGITAGLELQRELQPWPTGPRHAGVSSFGWGGTNVHVVLGEAPAQTPVVVAPPLSRPRLLVVSADDDEALRAGAHNVLAELDGSGPTLADLCHTLGARRAHLARRLALVGDSAPQLRERLEAVLANELPPRSPAAELGPVFVFCGSGGDWPGMGHELLRDQARFASAWRRCDEALRPRLGAKLTELLASAGSSVLPPSIAQPAVFALQVALTAQWKAWGIEPAAVIGHSFGEIAAAHVAGALSLDDAAQLICARGRLVDEVAGRGATAVLGLPLELAQAELYPFADAIAIAGQNDPRTTLVSGEAAAIEALVKKLGSRGVFCRQVAMPFAGHSAFMDPLLDPLAAAIVGLRATPTTTPMCSTVTGEWSTSTKLGVEYWPRNLRQPVRFAPAIDTALDAGHRVFVEVGPQPLQGGSIRSCARARELSVTTVASQRRDTNGSHTLLAGLGQLYQAGLDPRFSALEPEGELVPLAPYSWTHQHYWLPLDDSVRPSKLETRSASSPSPFPSPAPSPFPSPAPSPISIRARVREHVTDLLGLASPGALSDTRPVRDYGLDSLLRLELRARLERDLRLSLPVSFAVDHPTIAAMVEDLEARTRPDAEKAVEPSPAPRLQPRATPASDEAIAIVGASCRLPGASDLDAYWELLAEGRHGIVPVPPERWSLDEWYNPDPRVEGKTYMCEGGFLGQDLRGFDADFFGISAREARSLDPQQRLLLEVGWESLEDARIVPSSLRGTETGVFVGVSTHEYGQRHIDSGSCAALDAYSLSGNSLSVVSGRLAFVLGLEGPVMSVDTACSSGLTALHLACKSLRAGECDLALAGGVDLLLSPIYVMFWSELKILSPSNRSRSFDAAADGFAKGEGCVALTLKRLSDAVRDGDRVRAVIRGTSVIHDGRGSAMVEPRGCAHVRGLNRALADARLEPGDLSYIEAHAMGSPIADAIEVEALGEVCNRDSSSGPTIPLGSVKANLGHLGASGGLAAVLKVVCSLEHGQIPPQVNFEEPSPHIPWARLPFEVPRELSDWSPVRNTRVAVVSSMGLGGTTGIAVVEQAPARPSDPPAAEAQPAEEQPAKAQPAGPFLVPLSAHDDAALRDLAGRLAALDSPGLALPDLVHTAVHARDHLQHRAVVLSESLPHLREALRDLADGRARPDVIRATTTGRPRVVFVFTGMGAQWPGMGLDTIAREPVFRATIEACEQAFRRQGLESLTRELAGLEGRAHMDSIEIAQPAIFSIEVALVALWRSWGVEPDVVVGHSLGEFAAAHIAGALTLDQAAELLTVRGRLLATAAGTGTMAVIGLSTDDVRAQLQGIPPLRCCVATCNGPKTTVVAGDVPTIDKLVERLGSEGVFCRKLDVQAAYHSPQMNHLVDEFVRQLPYIVPAPCTTPMYLTLNDAWAHGDELGPRYWARNMRDEVHFVQAMDLLMDREGPSVMVEIGPNADLRWAMNQCRGAARADRVTILPSMRRDHDSAQVLGESLATLHAIGVPVDLGVVTPPGKLVDLPHYPWQRRRYWLEAPRPGATSVASPSEDDPLEAPSSAASKPTTLRDRWRAAPVQDREAVLREGLRGLLVSVLAPEPGVELRLETTFAELGMDSFMAMSLADRLGHELDLQLSSTLAYDCPSLAQLVETLAPQLGEPSPPSPTTHAEVPSEVSSEVLEPPPVDNPQAGRQSNAEDNDDGYEGDDEGEDEGDADAIAIIGASCRFPGGVVDLASLWQLLDEGRDAVTEIPASRFDLDTWYDPTLARPGSMCSRTAGLLDDIAGFDAEFFAVAPREAISMDPQHRLALELSWEAIEHAGLSTTALANAHTGVFLGISSNDYSRRHIDAGAPERVDAYSRMGIAYSVAAGRISYALGLRGPSLAIDTACSSSLVAMHYAATSLGGGECDLALAGGVGVLLKPEVFASLSRLGVLSREGRIRAFDADADGYVRAEGCAMVVLKRLADARRDGDRVLAVIRGSAVGHNGRSNGLSAPSSAAQQQVIRAAIDRAGVSPSEIDYLEAHGTGTTLGDAIETKALSSVFSSRETELPIGSVKTNLGHLEAAAGIAGVLKVVCAMQNDKIPRQLHFDEPSPRIDWSGVLRVVDAPRAWSGQRRLAGVSSFGANGTNAHLVLKSSPRPTSTAPPPSGPWLLPCSARSPEALHALARGIAVQVRDASDTQIADICFTAGARRLHHRHRLAVVAIDGPSLAAALESRASGVETSTGEVDAVLEDLTKRYMEGATLDFEALYPEPRRVVDLPRYPWQHQTYWLDRAQPWANTRAPDREHPLLHSRRVLGLSPRSLAWDLDIDGARSPFLRDHRFRGSSVSTGAIHLEFALHAVAAPVSQPLVIEDFEITHALVVPERGSRSARFLLTEQGPGRHAFQTLELDDEREPSLLARGVVRTASASELRHAPVNLRHERAASTDQLDGERFYTEAAIRGLELGGPFRRVERVWIRPKVALAELSLPETLGPAGSGFVIHPAFLDACSLVMLVLLPAREHYLGLGFERLVLHRALPVGASLWARATLRPETSAGLHHADLSLLDAEGDTLLEIRGLTFKALAKVVREPAPRSQGQGPGQASSSEVEARVRATVAHVADFPAAWIVPVTQPLAELGLDSIMLVEVLALLEAEFGVALNLPEPSIASLSARLYRG